MPGSFFFPVGEFSLGYSGKLVKTAHYQVDGLFAGASARMIPHIDLIIKYHRMDVNLGTRLTVKNRVILLIQLFDMGDTTAGLSYRFIL